jgi:hypothetical protein
MSLYGFSWTGTREIGIGTGDYAFEPTIGLPAYSLLGVGMPFERQLNPLQPPQSYYIARQYMIGLHGVVAGQIVGQPLIDTGQLGNL